MTHQHVTKKTRTKRDDTRPNSKIRMKRLQKMAKQQDISSERVTRVQTAQKKERIVKPLHEMQALAAVGSEVKSLPSDESYIRSLKKKLRAIEILLDKQKQGESLNAQQLEKIDKLDTLLSELENIVSLAV